MSELAGEDLFGLLLSGLVTSVFFGVLFLYPLWRSLSRAGFKPTLSLMVVIPFVGYVAIPILVGVLAFGKWPAIEGPAEETSWRAFSRTSWLSVSREEAARNRYYGLDGWVLAFFALSATGLVSYAVNFFNPFYNEIFQQEYGLTSDGVTILTLFLMAWSSTFLIFLPMKYGFVPKLMIALAWLYWLIYFGIIFKFGSLTLSGTVTLFFSPVFSLLYTWYWLKSKRVNVTYLCRIPAP
ncbi:MAG: hypothetical protein GKS00_29480 [Alphaproteobacteria bacterium]|nr:hypothetical protein [Alphaproteobacteria bacterium]